MKKVASLIGIAILASATTLAVAGGNNCHKKFDGQGSQAHYSKMNQKGPCSARHNGERHCQFHGKMRHHQGSHGKYGMMQQNISPEKRQALMQLKIENKIERMTQKLDLTAEQQRQVRTVLQKSQKEMQQLRQQKRKEINKILTEEQQAKKRQFRHGSQA